MPCRYKKIYLGCICFIFAVFSALLFAASPVSASNIIDELRQKIADNNNQITEIRKQIDELQKQLDKTGSDVKNLKNQISRFVTTIKKLRADIKLTEAKIAMANNILEELDIEIKNKEKEISENKNALAETIRNINEAESQSLIEILLADVGFSGFFNDLERMDNLRSSMNASLNQLMILQSDLKNQETKKEKEMEDLQNLHSSLADQKTITEMQNNQKNILLKETQNKESLYKKQLAEQMAKQQALENEISAFEEQIRIEIDPNSLPKTGSGVLSWPVDNPTVTQYFGDTRFATQNPQVYGGKGHDGIDLRAPVGTPIKAARLGIVTAVRNTVSYCRGYQIGYGNWVLIKHDNNLSTFYAHLTQIKVSPGDSVETGQLIGYSGNTGYTTGPHLHFGVFATQAIAGLEYTSTSPTCGGITMHQPIVPPNGKLNPLSYL